MNNANKKCWKCEEKMTEENISPLSYFCRPCFKKLMPWLTGILAVILAMITAIIKW